MISFTIYGEPFGKKRPRANIIAGHAHIHNDPENERYELKVINAYQKAVGKQDTPTFCKGELLSVIIHSFYPIPKAFGKKKRELANKFILRPTKKPDCDNIAKSILDALNHIAYYDDSQVVQLSVSKNYSENPFTAVTISAYDEQGEIK